MVSSLPAAPASAAPSTDVPSADAEARHPFLVALGERMRLLRTRRGMTRKAVAQAADVSERHLANLEYGTGNASILVLLQLAEALQCPLAQLVGDVSTSSPTDESRRHRIALIGLRGAGKSTLGRRLANDLGCPFIELSREIERLAGCSVHEIHALYGTPAYRRHERRALEETIQTHARAVIATPGGLVSEAASFNLLLAHCTTVWLQADPADHMDRVVAQGDLRPMAASPEAMEDLKRILAGRSAFYARADMHFNTSAHAEAEAFEALRRQVLDLVGPDGA